MILVDLQSEKLGAPQFELVLATISRCTAWSWRNSGMMLMNIAVIEPGQQAMVERLRHL